MRFLVGSAAVAVLAFPLAAGAATPTPGPSPTVVTVAPVTVAGTVALNNGATSCLGATYTAEIVDTVRDTSPSASGTVHTVTEPSRSGTVAANCTYAFTLPPLSNGANVYRRAIRVTVGGAVMVPLAITGYVQGDVGATGTTTLPLLGMEPKP
jgi:hypothetical protein